MTTEKAFDLAIESIKIRQDLQGGEKNKAIAAIKAAQKKDIYKNWNKKEIIKVLKEFEVKNNRPPNVGDLITYGMPKALTIRSYFGVNASVFLKQLFPESAKASIKKPVRKYDLIFKSEQEWKQCFVNELKNMNHLSMINGKLYNLNRRKESPAWETIARHIGAANWSELIQKTGTARYTKKKPTARNFTIVSESPSMNQMAELLKEKQELNQDLYNILYTKTENQTTEFKNKYLNNA